jgi:hypothetical protein
MKGNIEPAIIRVGTWTTVEFAVIPRVITGRMRGVRSARQRSRVLIPATLAGGRNRVGKPGKALRHGRWRW